eukprot:351849-Chlamydomonas_euryale.AAC.2
MDPKHGASAKASAVARCGQTGMVAAVAARRRVCTERARGCVPHPATRPLLFPPLLCSLPLQQRVCRAVGKGCESLEGWCWEKLQELGGRVIGRVARAWREGRMAGKGKRRMRRWEGMAEGEGG